MTEISLLFLHNRLNDKLLMSRERLISMGYNDCKALAWRIISLVLDRPVHMLRLMEEQSKYPRELFIRLEKIAFYLISKEPLEYIVNQVCFMGMDLYVDNKVLIPRDETDSWVQYCVDYYNGKDSSIAKVLWDVGCGSGCIGISLAKYVDIFRDVVFLDVSKYAVGVTKYNVKKIFGKNISKHFSIKQSLFLSSMEQSMLPDVLVANMPYVGMSDVLIERLNDPKVALFSDNSGMFHNQQLLCEIVTRYNKNPKPLDIWLESASWQINSIKQFLISIWVHDKKCINFNVWKNIYGNNQVLIIKLQSYVNLN